MVIVNFYGFFNRLLEGQRVKPDALIKSGFQFAYPTIDTALVDILQK
jgi:NAD dependent epimerase/dehydratase family enzyme